MSKSPAGFSVHNVTLTPELAAELLADNKMNRRVREDWVDSLARELTEGRWYLNGDTLKIDSAGQLADGQHRCLAVIKSGISYDAIIVREIDPKSRVTMDDPMRRRFSDDLVMNGMGPNAVVKEVTLRRILQWHNDHGLAGGHKVKVSRAVLSAEYPKYDNQIERALKMVWSHSRNPLGQSISAFVAWLLLQNADWEVVDKFFSILSIGSQDEQDRVVVQLRDRVLTLKNDPMMGWRGAGKAPIFAWLTIKAWNAWLTGKPTSMTLPRNRVLENPFPQPARLSRGGE